MIRLHTRFAGIAFGAVLGLFAATVPAGATIQSDSSTSDRATAATGGADQAIVVADNDHKGKGKGKNWNKGRYDWGKNDNWKKNNNWSRNNYNKNWNKNWNNDWPKHWAHYNNNWNKNWNNRAYVRGWNKRPYYGEFVGGVVLGSILAATGVGIVPYAPQPNLCWYWADPYMYRGYWDYCY